MDDAALAPVGVKRVDRFIAVEREDDLDAARLGLSGWAATSPWPPEAELQAVVTSANIEKLVEESTGGRPSSFS